MTSMCSGPRSASHPGLSGASGRIHAGHLPRPPTPRAPRGGCPPTGDRNDPGPKVPAPTAFKRVAGEGEKNAISGRVRRVPAKH
jgi:hypothetical protein